jgi:integrase
MGEDTEPEFEFLSEESVSSLNFQQKVLYSELWSELIEWLRTEGKKPERNVGYKESNVRPVARRIHQSFNYAWERDRLVLELTPELATRFVEDLQQDEFTRKDGKPYEENSKRKFKQALEAYFRFTDQDWEPGIAFSDETPSFNSDPFNRRERELLLNGALEYQSPPSYSNLSPEERDRTKARLAQILGKPKEDITRSDWEELRRNWKYPSLISTSLDAGWRAEMVGRLQLSHLDLANGQIIIPADVAVKNDKKWTVTPSERSIRILEKWLDQRVTNTKYDDSDNLWLNRNGNSYDSGNLKYSS